jgi:ankyrin repeat protein
MTLPAILAFALGAAVLAPASAEPLPKPSPLAQKDLDAKGISYDEWLLFHGIREGNIDYVRTAVKAGVHPEKARNPIGTLSALSTAVSSPRASPKMVSILVEHGADVNRRWTPKLASGDAPGANYFPLYQAARLGNAEVVEALLQKGADVNARVSHGGTALHATFDVEIGKVLQRYGADLNARKKNGQTPLANARRAAAQQNGDPRSPLRAKVEAYSAWLASQGAVE